jgi:hypothetical protein
MDWVVSFEIHSDIPLLFKEGAGWLVKARSNLIDVREAHLLKKRKLRDVHKEPLCGTLQTTPTPPLKGGGYLAGVWIGEVFSYSFGGGQQDNCRYSLKTEGNGWLEFQIEHATD